LNLVKKFTLQEEPKNPYYLVESLGNRQSSDAKKKIPREMHPLIREAIETCTQHARAGTELPQAHFTRGRLHLLIGEFETAYGFYARGIRHYLNKDQVSPADTMDNEESWLNLISRPGDDENMDHIRTLLLLGKAIYGDEKAKNELFERNANREVPHFKGDVMIIAGGASYMTGVDLAAVKRLIKATLENFEGTIISGGTSAGIPGMVGEAVKDLKKTGKHITLFGYVPSYLHSDVHKSKDYDQIIVCPGRDFSADQLHQSWIDLLRANIDPKTVKLLGINGGKISAMEYRLAAALGATTGIIMNSGREADRLFSDADWQGIPNLLFIPNEVASANLFVSKE
jgi:hypothetical protein